MAGIVEFIEDNFELGPGEPIELYSYQKDFLMDTSRFRIVNKARQVGMSSCIAWEALSTALLKPNQTVLFISIAERQAMELLRYVKRVLANLNRRQHIKTLENTKTLLRFDNNSRIMSLPNSPNTVQGIRAHKVYIDEYALFERDEEMLRAILPSISLGGNVTMNSRPRGARGEFHRIFQEAKQGKNDFSHYEIPYTMCPNKKYQESMPYFRKILGDIGFRETYCCEFIDEATSFFPYELMIPCIDDSIASPRPSMSLKMGVDFGRKESSTVITTVELRNDMWFVRKIKEFLGVSYTIQLGYLGMRINDLKPEAVKVDEYGVGVRLFEELREKHGSTIIPVQLSNPMKNNLITDLRILFEDKKIRIPRNEKLIQQLHALKKTVSGGYIKWTPGKTDDYGKHDDYVWSLAMAVSGKSVPQLRYFKVGDVSKDAIGFSSELHSANMSDGDEI